MKTRIISAFPGTGKTFFYDNNKTKTLDSDSSNFSWIKDENGNNTKERNPDFPQNYIDHIKENIGKYEFILVSSHKEVRDSLKENCLFFYLVYPDRFFDKERFIQRYIDRGSPKPFIDLVDKNWDSWIKECEFEMVGCKQVRMALLNLTDEINHIICSENGEKK